MATSEARLRAQAQEQVSPAASLCEVVSKPDGPGAANQPQSSLHVGGLAPFKGAAQVVQVVVENTCWSVNRLGRYVQRFGSSEIVFKVAAPGKLLLTGGLLTIQGVVAQGVEQTVTHAVPSRPCDDE